MYEYTDRINLLYSYWYSGILRVCMYSSLTIIHTLSLAMIVGVVIILITS